MRTLIDHHLATRDPLGLGDGEAGYLASGQALTLGMCFPYPEGGFALRRRSLYPTPATEWTLCGFARPGEATIESNDGVAHDADQAYQYAAARVFGNGYAGDWCEPVRVDFDDNGDLITPPLPLWPQHVAAQPRSGGRFLVTWEYDPFGQGAWPADFQVFEGPDADNVDYGTPLTDGSSGLWVIPLRVDRKRFELLTPFYDHGSQHVFVVRARNAAGVAEKNTNTTATVTASAAAPEAARIDRAVQRR